MASTNATDIAYYLVGDYHKEGVFKLSMVASADNFPDGLTKPLVAINFKFAELVQMMKLAWESCQSGCSIATHLLCLFPVVLGECFDTNQIESSN